MSQSDLNDTPAIRADPFSYASYLRDQAGYYRSQNSEFSLRLASELEALATIIEQRIRRREARLAAEAEPAF